MPAHTYVVVTNAGGTIAPFPTSGTVPAIPFYGGSTTSGSTSQPIHLPPLISARVYISYGPLSITVNSGPSPWAGDSSKNVYWDFIEYNWASTTSTAFVDTSQVNAIGLALTTTLSGAGSPVTTGFKSGSITQIANGINAIGSPWTTLTSQMPYRVLAPVSVQWGPGGNAGLPGFFPGNFNDANILAAWNAYQAPNWMTLQNVGGGFSTLYGQVDAGENFNFYTAQSTSSQIVATIPSPFGNAYGFTETATEAVYLQNQPFLLPASMGSGSWPYNATNAAAAGTIGNMVSTAINRGVFNIPIQSACGVTLYPGASYQNQYAAVVHKVAANVAYGYSQAYALPYDDQCNNSTTITNTAPTSLSVTINPYLSGTFGAACALFV